MSAQHTDLPDDIEALKALIVAQQTLLDARAVEIERLNLLIAKLKRLQFGRRSEKLDREIEQLELRLEELQVSAVPAVTVTHEKALAQQPVRRPLSEHLPRTRIEHTPACTCPDCGAAMRNIGEDVAEILEYVPARFRVIQHVRPKFACPECEASCRARHLRDRLSADSLARDCSHTFWSPSTAITCRSTGRRRSTHAKASNWNVPRWRSGLRAVSACSSHSLKRWRAM